MIRSPCVCHNGDAQPIRLRLKAVLPDQRDDVLMTLSTL